MPAKLILSIVMLSTCFAGVAPWVWAEPQMNRDFKDTSLPIPINVEGERVRSALFLNFKIHYYNSSLDQFATLAADAREKAFFRLADGIRKKDYAQVEQILRPVTSPAANNKTTVTPNSRTARQTVDLYQSAFGGFRDIWLICQVLVGSKSLFVWESRSGSVQLKRAFAVTERNGRSIATEVTMDNPLDLLIVSIFEQAGKEPDSYKPPTNFKPRFRVKSPTSTSANSNPAYFEFDGEPMNLDVFDTKVSTSNEVARFYRSAYLPFKNKQIDRFMEFHTAKSQAKLRSCYATMSPDVFATYHETATRGRYIKFILDANPVYIVFYSQESSPDWDPAYLNYQYIIRENQGFRIANVFFESFLDDVLKSDDLFDKRVLKTLRR